MKPSVNVPVSGGLRTVTRAFAAIPVSDGDGVAMKRAIGHDAFPMLDPFLLLDEFRVDAMPNGGKVPGFPDHPHRGFETVTYMLAGRMRHRDSMGRTGAIAPGGVQWMTAGRGIIHSEMPELIDGRLWGFQLWVNLPAAEKMRKPLYQEYTPDRVPEVLFAGGASGRLIAGELGAVSGAVHGSPAEPFYLDLRLRANGPVTVPVPAGHNAFVYVHSGEVEVAGPEEIAPAGLSSGSAGMLSDGGAVQFRTSSGAGLLLIAARPLGEPVARYGPFVMNNRGELAQAFADYRNGAFL